MKNARIYFDPETGSGDLYYKGEHICRVKFPEGMRKAIADNTKYILDLRKSEKEKESKRFAETTTT